MEYPKDAKIKLKLENNNLKIFINENHKTNTRIKPEKSTSFISKIKNNTNKIDEELSLTISNTSKNENTKNNNNSASLLEITDKSVFFSEMTNKNYSLINNNNANKELEDNEKSKNSKNKKIEIRKLNLDTIKTEAQRLTNIPKAKNEIKLPLINRIISNYSKQSKEATKKFSKISSKKITKAIKLKISINSNLISMRKNSLNANGNKSHVIKYKNFHTNKKLQTSIPSNSSPQISQYSLNSTQKNTKYQFNKYINNFDLHSLLLNKKKQRKKPLLSIRRHSYNKINNSYNKNMEIITNKLFTGLGKHNHSTIKTENIMHKNLTMPYDIKKFAQKKINMKKIINKNSSNSIQNNSKRNSNNKNSSKGFEVFCENKNETLKTYSHKSNSKVSMYKNNLLSFMCKLYEEDIKTPVIYKNRKFSKSNSSRAGRSEFRKYSSQDKIKKILFKPFKKN